MQPVYKQKESMMAIQNEDLITIVVPTYNSEKYISRCIESIINQTYSKLEIIIVDDNSIDDTTNIVKKYQKKDSRITLLVNNKKGPLSARIYGTKESKGKYLTFIDSDDWIEKDMIEVLHKKIKQYSADIVKCSYKIIRKDKKTPVYRKKIDYLFDDTNRNELYRELSSNYIFHSLWSQLIRSSIIKNIVDLVDTSISMGDDLEMNLQLLVKCNKILVTGDLLYNYMYNTNSLSKNRSIVSNKSRIDDLIKVYAHFIKTIKNHCESEKPNAMKKVFIDINNNMLNFANCPDYNSKELLCYISNIGSCNLMQGIRDNTNYDDYRGVFLKCLYKKKYRKYVLYLSLLKKLRSVKNI